MTSSVIKFTILNWQALVSHLLISNHKNFAILFSTKFMSARKFVKQQFENKHRNLKT